MLHKSWQKSVQKLVWRRSRHSLILGFIFTIIFIQNSYSQGTKGSGVWLPAKDQTILKSFLPPEIELPDTIQFYNHAPVFQMDGFLTSIFRNPAALPDPFGNANREFPWIMTSGLHLAPKTDYHVYKFASIPGPIRYYRGLNRNRNNTFFSNELAPIVWEYPQGTVFGEMLLNRNNQVFEVRTRIKASSPGQQTLWTPETYRPYSTIDDLPALNGVPAHNNPSYKTITRNIKGAGVDANIEMISVPALPDSLLKQEFRKSKLILTTNVPNNIIPLNYLGNVTTCTSCHNQTQKHSRQIDPVREWYGNVRGSDQIFSFSIFDESSISYNGIPLPIFLRTDLNLIEAK